MTRKTKFQAYKEGQQVWLEGTNLKITYESAKLSPKWYRPFRVATIISPIAYRLELPPTWKIHPVFHTSLLTPYKETELHGPNFLEPPPIKIEGGEPKWEVEKILGDRIYRKKKQYLVRWKDYLPAHNSWVDDSDLHSPELLSTYKAAQSAGKNPSQQSARDKNRKPTHIRTTYLNILMEPRPLMSSLNYDHCYTEAALHNTWLLAKAASEYYHYHTNLPWGIRMHTTDILIFATYVDPPTLCNSFDAQDCHHLIYQALREAKPDLIPFLVIDQDEHG